MLNQSNTLTEDYIRNNKDKVDWYQILESQHLSEDFIREFKDRINWHRLLKNQKLSEPLIRENTELLNWTTVSMYQRLSENFIGEFQDRVNWIQISSKQSLSEDFIRKYKDKIFPRFLLKNENQLYYSSKFIIDLKPYFNNYYRYNVAANKIRNIWVTRYYKPGNIGHLRSINNLNSILKD